jgi:RNA polymerase sigma-70 factor (ECF subfamily)
LDDTDADHALILRIAAKDMGAYRALVDKHIPTSLRFAERMLGNRSDAEDVMQDTCLKIWNEAPRWKPQARFSTWLYRVVYNACIDQRRKKIPVSDVALERFADTAINADATIMQRQASEQVRGAMTRLPERQRAALILCYYEELSNQQAADVLGVNLGTLQQLLFRARQNLKELLMPLPEYRHG